MNADDCAVDQFHLNLWIASLKSNLFLGLDSSALLDFINNEFHLGCVELALWLRPFVVDRRGQTFDKFTGDTDDNFSRLDTSLLLSLD